MKLCIIITVSQNLYSLYRDQFIYLKERGFDITAIASPGPEHQLLREQGIKTVEIAIKKRPSPVNDLISLSKIWFHLLTHRYDIVSVSTPKASLLGALAAFFTLHRKVIFTLRGRAYENEPPLKKRFYVGIDKLICFISSRVFCVSKEIRLDFINKRLVDQNKIFVIGEGSSNGVDLSKFTKTAQTTERAAQIRSKLGIAADSRIFLYSGRIRKDKGVAELVEAFAEVCSRYECDLVIQGAFDSIDPLDERHVKMIETHPRIHLEPWCYEVENYFAMADVFVFPSYREGFGNVAIEASAMELPVIAFNVIGCRESVVDNETGVLVEPYSAKALAETMVRFLEQPELRRQYGQNGRKRIEDKFDSRIIWNELIKNYREMVN